MGDLGIDCISAGFDSEEGREGLKQALQATATNKGTNGEDMEHSLHLGLVRARCRWYSLLANFPHFPQSLDEVLSERLGRSFRVRHFRFDTELEKLVSREV